MNNNIADGIFYGAHPFSNLYVNQGFHPSRINVFASMRDKDCGMYSENAVYLRMIRILVE